MSTRSEIMQAIADRLVTITSANGYDLNLKKVYYDKIPMGIQLLSHQLPCLFLLSDSDNPKMQNSCVIGDWTIRIQIWAEGKASDFQMDDYVRDVFKCIYANSSTAQVNDQFRSLHSKLVRIEPLSIDPDLNMIEANRVYELTFKIEYRTNLFSL